MQHLFQDFTFCAYYIIFMPIVPLRVWFGENGHLIDLNCNFDDYIFTSFKGKKRDNDNQDWPGFFLRNNDYFSPIIIFLLPFFFFSFFEKEKKKRKKNIERRDKTDVRSVGKQERNMHRFLPWFIYVLRITFACAPCTSCIIAIHYGYASAENAFRNGTITQLTTVKRSLALIAFGIIDARLSSTSISSF